MSEEIGLFEAIYTQRAIRELKPDPVSDDLVHKLIESATKAPSGGNRQPWRFIVIRDEELKRRIGEYYRRAWDASYGPRPAPRGSLQSHVRASATHLSEHLAEAPVLILACVEHGRLSGDDEPRLIHLPGGAEPAPGGAGPRPRQRDNQPPQAV